MNVARAHLSYGTPCPPAYSKWPKPSTSEQLEIFSSPTHAVSEAMDEINNKWGEFVITPALMMGMDDIILDRIAFGGVKELQELYE